jgi:hypothetical protein
MAKRGLSDITSGTLQWFQLGGLASLSSAEKIMRRAHLWPHVRQYNNDIAAILGNDCPSPTYPLHVSWGLGHPLGDLFNEVMGQFIPRVEQSFLAEIHANGVAGDVVEFGIYHGYMLEKLIEKTEELKMSRNIYGFDSFEGLSEPSVEHDYENWKKGQYAAGYDQVAAYLKLKDRPNLKLIKGWLNETLQSPEAQAIKKIAYARIDVDIYEPTKDCLDYLSSRLADGAILVFDDWCYTSTKGETKAFIDWVKTVPNLEFEWLGQCNWRFYLRVHHRRR